MADSESFHSHHHRHLSAAATAPSTFSQLLFCNDLDDHDHNEDHSSLLLGGLGDDNNVINQSFSYCCSSIVEKPPKMLCFGGYDLENIESDDIDQVGLFGSSSGNSEVTLVALAPQTSGVTTCSDTSSPPVPLANASSELNIRKRNGLYQAPAHMPSTSGKATPANKRTSYNRKKAKLENPSSNGSTRGRREKLGDRITALQQLVSPFGKTDTASVLHEAMGYIRFLHDQVQVLCSPYLQLRPEVEENEEGEETRKDLRSRGLCLVPVECTVHVSSSNGADYWSPGAMVNGMVTPADNYQAVNLN